MKLIYIKNFRKGFATNSSSTHSLIYKNKDDMFKDLDIFELDYYDRFDSTIAATREAKIKYICSQIFHNKFLLEVMCKYYPEMEQYMPLVKRQNEEYNKDYNDPTRDDRVFGSCARGDLELSGIDNIEFNVKYLSNIIDNDEIVIVGGSDEANFVYETCENHRTYLDLLDIDKKYNVVKNGNYWVGVNHWNGNRIRFNTTSDECIPEYPELIDLKITNKCNHGCKFCYMGSNMKGQHADIKFLKSIIHNVSSSTDDDYKKRVEFAIGGGNVLLYPDLEELFIYMHENNHIINTTINVNDVKEICTNETFKRIFNMYVNGVGISISNENDVEILNKYNINKVFKNIKFTLHLIPEMLGVETTRNIINEAKKHNYFSVLFLGYKYNNRGASIVPEKFTNTDLYNLFKDMYMIGVDTTFLNTYYDYISNNFEDELTCTKNEGEYSMYIDGVTKNAYKSSYQLDKPYNLDYDYAKYKYVDNDVNWFYVTQAFKHIRADNGFKTYKND